MMVQGITFILLATTLSLLGVLLYFKRMCMVANSLSHTSLLGVIMAFALMSKSMVEFSLDPTLLVVAALLSSFLTLFLMKVCQKVLQSQDASIGFVFTFLFALSILLVSVFAKHTHIAQEVIMGNLEFVETSELYMTLILFVSLIMILFFFYYPIRVAIFDHSFFAIAFNRAWFFECMLLTMTSLIITLSFRMIGLVAILGFLIVPVLVARMYVKSFLSVLLFCVLFSIICSFSSFALCQSIYEYFYIPLASNALSVIVMSVAFLVLRKLNKEKKLKIKVLAH